MSQKKGERGRGHIYLQHGAWYLQFYQAENRDGELVKVRRSVFLHDKDREHNTATCKAVKALRDSELTKLSTGPQITADDQRIVDYWVNRFLPYCEEELKTGPRAGQQRLKPSTLRGYKQVYRQHLKDHFGKWTLQKYQPAMGARLLDSLTAKQGFYVLKHIRAVGSAIFRRAVKDQIITVNPWSAVEMPDDAIEPGETQHYTREQSEDLVSALVDHVDAQLALSLACFLALGPAEIQGLEWGDVDKDWLHIRRNVVLGKEGTTKTIERAASLPLLDEVRVPLELWRKQCKDTGDGVRIIPDLHNLINRVIKPHVLGEKNTATQKRCTRCDIVPKASDVQWRGMYSARRGAITHAINVSGNIALGQRLARHASSATTSAFYHKAMPDAMFLDGMKRLNGKRET
ncbi:MAG: site-specific integrase [Acidobacteriia bacterium]|nr:site-specific integrase [Terriglobia bacterium]